MDNGRVILLSVLLLVSPATWGEEAIEMVMTLTSSVFGEGEEIPQRYTCDGEDVSPPLHWDGVPAGARSLALIVDDPDAPDPAAPKMVWVHWVLYNIPAAVSGLPAGAVELPKGTLQGVNDWQRIGYGGPCPPIGRHRYFFKLFALDTVLPDMERPTKQELLEAMRGHLLAEAVLTGSYRRR